MIIKDKFMGDLKEALGLNSYEIKLLLALMTEKISTVGILSGLSEVPRSRCYDILNSLHKKGFITIRMSDTQSFEVNTPKEILEKAKVNLKNYTIEKINKISKFEKSEACKEMEEIYKNKSTKILPEALVSNFVNNLEKELTKLISEKKKGITKQKLETDVQYQFLNQGLKMIEKYRKWEEGKNGN